MITGPCGPLIMGARPGGAVAGRRARSRVPDEAAQKKPPCGCRAAKIFDQGSNTRYLQRIGCVFRGFGFVVVFLNERILLDLS